MTFPNSPLSADDRARMTALTAGLPTKSAKIRKLSAAQYKRAEIATFLGIRYQHVRNVLEQRVTRPIGGAVEPPPLAAAVGDAASASFAGEAAAAETTPECGTIAIGADGALRLPPALVAWLRAAPGQEIVWRRDAGDLRLLGGASAVAWAQEQFAALAGDGPSMVDDLIAERRREAARETEPSGKRR